MGHSTYWEDWSGAWKGKGAATEDPKMVEETIPSHDFMTISSCSLTQCEVATGGDIANCLV